MVVYTHSPDTKEAKRSRSLRLAGQLGKFQSKESIANIQLKLSMLAHAFNLSAREAEAG